jgi:hypothetical protein
MAASATYGRVFEIMYDVSNMTDAQLVPTIQEDWKHLVDDVGVTGSGRYLNHRGKPLVSLWGIGIVDHAGTAKQAQALIDWFHKDAPPKYRASVMGGTCAQWRTRGAGCKPEPEWTQVYHSFDVISPWSVGGYRNEQQADWWKTYIVGDLKDTDANGVDYMPVIWPGFSWTNKGGGPLNKIPRNGGNFFWRQAYNAVSAGAKTVYVAMFDEVDEGTAMFKIAEDASQTPAQGNFVTMDADGIKLPSDWYLRLGGAATSMLRRNCSLSTSFEGCMRGTSSGTCGVMNPVTKLSNNGEVDSCNGKYRLIVQASDGNVVLYDPSGTALWTAKTAGHRPPEGRAHHAG